SPKLYWHCRTRETLWSARYGRQEFSVTSEPPHSDGRRQNHSVVAQASSLPRENRIHPSFAGQISVRQCGDSPVTAPESIDTRQAFRGHRGGRASAAWCQRTLSLPRAE